MRVSGNEWAQRQECAQIGQNKQTEGKYMQMRAGQHEQVQTSTRVQVGAHNWGGEPMGSVQVRVRGWASVNEGGLEKQRWAGWVNMNEGGYKQGWAGANKGGWKVGEWGAGECKWDGWIWTRGKCKQGWVKGRQTKVRATVAAPAAAMQQIQQWWCTPTPTPLFLLFFHLVSISHSYLIVYLPLPPLHFKYYIVIAILIFIIFITCILWVILIPQVLYDTVTNMVWWMWVWVWCQNSQPMVYLWQVLSVPSAL